MPNLFIAIVKDENNNVVFEHISNYSDDTVHADIWNNDSPLFVGEWRKFRHLESEIKKIRPNWTIIEKDFGEVSAEVLMNALTHKQ